MIEFTTGICGEAHYSQFWPRFLLPVFVFVLPSCLCLMDEEYVF